jgi:hypothetical protein
MFKTQVCISAYLILIVFSLKADSVTAATNLTIFKSSIIQTVQTHTPAEYRNWEFPVTNIDQLEISIKQSLAMNAKIIASGRDEGGHLFIVIVQLGDQLSFCYLSTSGENTGLSVSSKEAKVTPTISFDPICKWKVLSPIDSYGNYEFKYRSLCASDYKIVPLTRGPIHLNCVVRGYGAIITKDMIVTLN